MAKGEFALVKEYVLTSLDRSGQPVKRGTMAHEHNMYMLLVESAARLRDADGLYEFLPHFEQLAERDKHRLYLPMAWRARGVAHRLAGEMGSAAEELNRALEAFEQLGTRWQLGRTLFELGELEQERGNSARAGEFWARALGEFEALGAVPDAERTRAAMGSWI